MITLKKYNNQSVQFQHSFVNIFHFVFEIMVSISNVPLKLPDTLAPYYGGVEQQTHELFSRGVKLHIKSSANRDSIIEMRLCLTREVDESIEFKELYASYQLSSLRGKWFPFARYFTRNKLSQYRCSFSYNDFMQLDFIIMGGDFRINKKCPWFLSFSTAYKTQIMERLRHNYTKVYMDTNLTQPVVLIDMVMDYVFGENPLKCTTRKPTDHPLI